ncbi:hypothetical protein THOM_2727, partial [Trachipleistophora hominis]
VKNSNLFFDGFWGGVPSTPSVEPTPAEVAAAAAGSRAASYRFSRRMSTSYGA